MSLRRHFFPESNVGGFSQQDVGVALFTQIDSILRPSDHVLDFGAGRGEHIVDNEIEYRRRLFNLRGRCAHVEGCDVDDAVLENPFVDQARVIELGSPLPYPDNSFDIVYSRFVFEHIDNTDQITNELLRIVKPGGVIAALTPNRYGYIAVAGMLVPNRLHVRALHYIQPKRKSVDVFPTKYQLNTKKSLERAFGGKADVFVSYSSGEPAYHFNSRLLYGFFTLLHKYLPRFFLPLITVYIRKQ